jgi:hypothetical protein
MAQWTPRFEKETCRGTLLFGPSCFVYYISFFFAIKH